MIHCKKHIIVLFFILALPVIAWSEAPVVDDSDRFAMIDERQAQLSAVRPQYDEPLVDDTQIDGAQNDRYRMDNAPIDDDSALVKEDHNDANATMNGNAKLIDKIQGLQQEIQELRGQLEVQAHDLKLLQQQQLAFYKDLDARLAGTASKSMQNKTLINNITKKPTTPVAVIPTPAKTTKTPVVTPPIAPVSRTNPADEQISYLAAYELLKNKHYDEAITAMTGFVQKYPQGGYTANAEYWLGELYLVKKEYPSAIEHFEVVLQRFPSSSKSAASMLKAGYAFAATGDISEAKRRLQQVVNTYPDTPTARLAQSKLQTL